MAEMEEQAHERDIMKDFTDAPIEDPEQQQEEEAYPLIHNIRMMNEHVT